MTTRPTVYVDVIIPVHNAEATIEETVQSAMEQVVPEHLLTKTSAASPSPSSNASTFIEFDRIDWNVAVCCYDDGSTDKSWEILSKMKLEYNECSKISVQKESPSSINTQKEEKVQQKIRSQLLIGQGMDGVGRGAGFARNQAALMRSLNCKESFESSTELYFLCLLDSDDIMHPNRIAEQVHAMVCLPKDEMNRTIMGCNFDRNPPDSTWHYAKWANDLTDERLMLERFREVTVLQPTWMLTKSRFDSLGGYIVAPHPKETDHNASIELDSYSNKKALQLIHPTYDTNKTLRLAEDLRFVYAHLHDGGQLRLHRTSTPLVTYRHRSGQSQSSMTPRKLLLHLRAMAFEIMVLKSNPLWLQNEGKFVVWGAGRDGKDFVKALGPDARRRIACFVDIDPKKIEHGHYVNKDLELNIPIVHFSHLASDPQIKQKLFEAWQNEISCENNNEPLLGRITKSKGMPTISGRKPVVEKSDTSDRPKKKRKVQKSVKKNYGDLDISLLPSLPVVVCVAMYRTNGVLEQNVRSIGRTEGKNLWHFS